MAIGMLVYAAVALGLTPAAFAGGTRAGDAVPTNPQNNTQVTSGGSSTPWTLKLPSKASCSGDTATHAYHVYSFIVPASVDPGTLTFNPSTGPSQPSPLVDNTGSAYMAANTAQTTGQVIQIPTFDFNLFATTDRAGTKLALPPGDYKAGIACANTLGQGDKYWSTVFTITADGKDPNGEVWTNHSTPASTSGGGGTSYALPIAVAVIVFAGYFVYRRRRQTRAMATVR
jgi:hypothetical protein